MRSLRKYFPRRSKHGERGANQLRLLPESSRRECEDSDLPASATNISVIDKERNLGTVVLYSPETQSGSQVDIIFLHGLIGSSSDTWLHKETGIHWPRDLLKSDIPNSRIVSWGYDADVTSFWGHTSRNRLGEHARNLLGDLVRLREETNSEDRKVIFVAHSLGGLVVQKMLCLSRERAEPHLRSLESATIGIAFLGTPHNGSDLAAWAVLCARLVSKFQDVNVEVLETLERDSEVLRDTQDTFGQLLRIRENKGRPIHITCFYEELAMLGVGMVVPKSSACLFGYSYYGLPENHKAMPKFPTASNVGYGRVVGELKRWTKSLEKRVSIIQPPGNTSSGPSDLKEILAVIAIKKIAVSYPYFEDTLSHSSNSFLWLWRKDSSAFLTWLNSRDRLFWVAGKPGSGKTTLMRYVANRQSGIATAGDIISSNSNDIRDFIVATYFFNFQAIQVERSIEGLLRSLLHQLLIQDSTLFRTVFPTIKAKSDFESTLLPWSQWQLENAIRAGVESRPGSRFLFLVDGLDEFEGDCSVIARFIRLFSSRSPPNLKLCVSSRPYAEFNFEFSSVTRLFVENNTSEDIRQYISSRLSEVRSILGSDCDILEDKIAERADGLFLWVRLAMDSLQRGWRKYEDLIRLVQRLREMPRDLVDFYQRILDEMDFEDKSEAIRLLIIFSTARARLSAIEFFHAWSQTSSKCMFAGDQEDCSIAVLHDLSSLERQAAALKMFEGRVGTLSRGLIQVHEDAHGHTTFSLLHETVQIFVRDKLLNIALSSPSNPPILGNVLLLHACVHYLSQLFAQTQNWVWTLEPKKTESWSELETDYFNLGSVYLNYRDYIDRCQEYRWTSPAIYPFELGFLLYAVRSVLDYARMAEEESQSSNQRLMKQFSGITFELWRRLYQIHEVSLARQLPVNLLGLAITYGLNKYAEGQINALPFQQSDPSDYTRNPDYLLFEVAKTGNTHLARLLLARGATLHPTVFNGMEIALSGHRYLLGMIRHWGQSALPRAVAYDRGELTEFFLSHGASVETRVWGKWIVSGGVNRSRVLSLDAMSLTLKRSRRSVGVGRGFPTMSSSSKPQVTMEGVTVSHSNSKEPLNQWTNYNALFHAIELGSFQAFSAILPFVRKAGMHEILNEALIHAATQSLDNYVEKLLDYGADPAWSRAGINCTEAFQRNPCSALIAAAETGSPATIMALLHAGADPNFENSHECTVRGVIKAHGTPIDVLMKTLSLSRGDRQEKFIDSAKLMIKYGGKVDIPLWKTYVSTEISELLFGLSDAEESFTNESAIREFKESEVL